eukprot:1119068_1
MASYTYYDYLENYYESHYEYYYEHVYWPQYYGNYNGSNTTYNGTYPPSPYTYHHPFKMEYITPPLFTLSILCALCSIFIVLLVAYKVYHTAFTKRVNKRIMHITLFSEMVHLITNLADPVTFYAWYINYSYSAVLITDIIWETSWLLSKVSLYVIFIYRYYLIFKATPGTTTMQTYTIFGAFTVAMVIQCALLLMFVLLHYEVVGSKDSLSTKRMWLNACWAFLVLDILLICVLTYLLCYSVLKLVFRIQQVQLQAGVNAPTTQMSTVISITGSRNDDINDTTPKEIVTNSSKTNAKHVSQTSGVDSQRQRLDKWKNTATKVAVTMIVSMVSSFVYQLTWLLGNEFNDDNLLWMESTYCVDLVINMLCIYLSMAFAQDHYKRVCIDSRTTIETGTDGYAYEQTTASVDLNGQINDAKQDAIGYALPKQWIEM